AFALITNFGRSKLAAQIVPDQGCNFAVSVTPKGAAVTQSSNSTQTASFTVTNTSTCGQTFTFACTSSGTIQCLGLPSPSSAWIDGGCGGGLSPTGGPADTHLVQRIR